MRSDSVLQRRHLEAIVAVADHLSVHAAGRALGMQQPALSRLLSEAERQLGGVRLFDRSSQGCRCTELGERVVAQSRFILQGMLRLAQTAEERRPHVRVGCIARAMHTLMPLVLERIWPDDGTPSGIQLELAEGSSTGLVESLVRGDLEFAIVRGVGAASNDASLELEPLYQEQTSIVCAAHHPLARFDRLSLATLADQEWVLPQPQTGSRTLFDGFWSTHGLPPIRPVLEARSFETSVALVEKTRFLSIAPKPIAQRYAGLGLLRVLRTREALPTASVVLAYTRGSMGDPVLQQMRAIIHEACRKAQGDEGRRRRPRARS